MCRDIPQSTQPQVEGSTDWIRSCGWPSLFFSAGVLLWREKLWKYSADIREEKVITGQLWCRNLSDCSIQEERPLSLPFFLWYVDNCKV
mmetsp:Transcript_10750/g.18220  ORF Transcript_10750/g.18220 Transcript_10750/m.18220 type:complete len:89 (+) Transcript_10750:108-374(+)